MEWLWGIVVGFILGLAGGRVQARWDRERRAIETAESLSGEIALNKQKIEYALPESSGDGVRPMERYLVVPFLRDAFSGRVVDPGLLPGDTRVATQRFCARLHDLELVVYEGYLRQTIFPLRELELRASQTEDQDAWEWWHDRTQTLHRMFEQRARDAIEAGDAAIEQLSRLRHRPWWRRAAGR